MEKPRLKVFLDTSALIAGIASSKGAARELLRLAELELIDIVLSRQVIVEADRNIEAKMPEVMYEYRAFIELLAPTLIDDPSPENVKKYSCLIDPDDAPILAAAVLSGVDYLVTWDRKHFLKSDIKINSHLKILAPGEFLKYFRRHIETER
jgi:predicted nucleic acid-binding protein